MMNFAETLKAMQQDFPKLAVRDYRSNWFFDQLWKLGWRMGATTIWNTIFMDGALIDTQVGAETLRHEFVHVKDQHKWHVLFFLSYFLLPVGPSFKAFWEWRAYKVSLQIALEKYWSIQSVVDEEAEWVARQFWSSGYAFMWPFPWMVRGWVRNEIARLRSGWAVN